MTVVFRDYIARFVHVYLDDIFIYSSSIEEHEKHLELVFNKLREARLYLSRDKVDLYSQRMDCLSHIISDAGIHACVDKDAEDPGLATTPQLSRRPKVPWTRSISGAFPARYYRIHVASINMCPKWEAIRMDPAP